MRNNILQNLINVKQYVLFFIFLVTIVLLQVNIVQGITNLSVSRTDDCTKVRCKIHLDILSDEYLYIGMIYINSSDFILSRDDSAFFQGSGFLDMDYLIRLEGNYLEFFDMVQEFQSGYIDIYIINVTNTNLKDYYEIDFIPLFQRINDSLIDISPILLTLDFEQKNILDVTLIDRFNRTNQVVAGDLMDIRFNNPYSGMIDYQVIYDGLIYQNSSIEANTDNILIEDKINTKTFETVNNFTCPKDNLTVKFITYDESKTESETLISVREDIPRPSDIYYNVNQFFEDNRIETIERVYYMVGIYFNCLREQTVIYS